MVYFMKKSRKDFGEEDIKCLPFKQFLKKMAQRDQNNFCLRKLR